MSVLLETNELAVTFGNQHALLHLNLVFYDHELTSIIGPNGAGKTTLFNALSGEVKPSVGHVYYRGRDITSLPPQKRTRLGIGRSFQMTNVFPNFTCLENVRLAIQAKEGLFYRLFRSKKVMKTLEAKAYQALSHVNLENKAFEKAIHLTHGEQRKLELAMLLALETDVLLLDEPTAGMAIEEVPMVLDLIKKIQKEQKRTILLIEHKMDMILDVSDRVIVLVNGQFLADGSPSDMMKNEDVKRAYLGGGLA